MTEDGSMSVYRELHRQGREAVAAARWQKALPLFEKAWEWAREHGDRTLVDRAFCNRASVLISLGHGEEVIATLREILMRNADQVNARLAAYNISRIYEHRKEPKKGLFYARIAHVHAQKIEDVERSWIASDHNQMGNFLVADSRFEEAIAEYRKALAADPEATAIRRAFVEQNMGYCYLVLGSHRMGFELLFRSLRTFRHHGVRHQRMHTHLDVCFGYLEIGRYERARQHGLAALELAREFEDADCLKKALYLLGEAENLLGYADNAKGYFDQLQEYFPDTPFVSDFLLAIDVRKMINLRA